MHAITMKSLIIILAFYLGGCTVGGCALLAAHEFTLTFLDAKGEPKPDIKVTCSGTETAHSIANEFNDLHLMSDKNGKIRFHRRKTGKSFSYRTVGFYSWGERNSNTTTLCVFSLDNKEIYRANILASQPSYTVTLK